LLLLLLLHVVLGRVEPAALGHLESRVVEHGHGHGHGHGQRLLLLALLILLLEAEEL